MKNGAEIEVMDLSAVPVSSLRAALLEWGGTVPVNLAPRIAELIDEIERLRTANVTLAMRLRIQDANGRAETSVVPRHNQET